MGWTNNNNKMLMITCCVALQTGLYRWFHRILLPSSFTSDYLFYQSLFYFIFTTHYLMSHSCLACLCPRHDFQYMLFCFGFINTHVPVHAHHLAFTSSLVGLHLTILDSYVQILERGAQQNLLRRLEQHNESVVVTHSPFLPTLLLIGSRDSSCCS